jgi:hypothetical protein
MRTVELLGAVGFGERLDIEASLSSLPASLTT